MKPEFNPNLENEKQNHFKTLFKLLVILWDKERYDLRVFTLVSILFLILAKTVNVYVPFLYKSAVDMIGLTQVQIPIAIIVAYGGARVLSQLFSEIRDYLFAISSQYTRRKIALNTFKHLHQLSLSFHLSRQTGGLSRVIERGTEGIHFVLNFLIYNIAPTLFEIVMVTSVLLYKFHLKFGLTMLITIVLYVLYTLLATEWRIKFRLEMNQTESMANTKAIDSLLNYETVKYFNNEAHEHQRFDESLAKFEKAAVSSQATLSVLNIGQGIIIAIGLILLMYWSAVEVKMQSMTVGDFVMLNTFVIQLYLPLNFLGFIYREMKQGLIGMDKMFELINVEPQVQDRVDAVDLKAGEIEIEFKNVSFSYLKERKILEDVSFKIMPSKTLAVVGPSGSGKSTLARLLYRFYDVDQGQILINSKDIRAYTQQSIRKHMGIVPQDTVLFNDTIEYNIQYGNLKSDQNTLIHAAQMAKIHDFIESLPQKYQSTVGERGLKLSGGEKQRVAIARTILKNPPFFIFDEATSALDTHTEKDIQESLNRVSVGKTTLMVAHRLSTVCEADEIIVLDQGKIKERGSHDELILKNGLYKAMWDKQKQQEGLKD